MRGLGLRSSCRRTKRDAGARDRTDLDCLEPNAPRPVLPGLLGLTLGAFGRLVGSDAAAPCYRGTSRSGGDSGCCRVGFPAGLGCMCSSRGSAQEVGEFRLRGLSHSTHFAEITSCFQPLRPPAPDLMLLALRRCLRLPVSFTRTCCEGEGVPGCCGRVDAYGPGNGWSTPLPVGYGR